MNQTIDLDDVCRININFYKSQADTHTCSHNVATDVVNYNLVENIVCVSIAKNNDFGKLIYQLFEKIKNVFNTVENCGVNILNDTYFKFRIEPTTIMYNLKGDLVTKIEKLPLNGKAIINFIPQIIINKQKQFVRFKINTIVHKETVINIKKEFKIDTSDEELNADIIVSKINSQFVVFNEENGGYDLIKCPQNSFLMHTIINIDSCLTHDNIKLYDENNIIYESQIIFMQSIAQNKKCIKLIIPLNDKQKGKMLTLKSINPKNLFGVQNHKIYYKNFIVPDFKNTMENCTICCDELKSDIYMTCCNHEFHMDCIYGLISASRRDTIITTNKNVKTIVENKIVQIKCPLCRRLLFI